MLALLAHYVKGDPHHGIPFPAARIFWITILMCGGLFALLFWLSGGVRNDKET